MSIDVTFTKDGATKTLPESFTDKMKKDGWKVDEAALKKAQAEALKAATNAAKD